MTDVMTRSGERSASIPADGGSLRCTLAWPTHPSGIVVIAPGGDGSRPGPRSLYLPMRLRAAGLATLVFDLLTESDAADWGPVCDTRLLAGRLLAGIEWAAAQPEVEGLSIGLYGAGIGAAAALLAAAEEPEAVAAVVCRGGRPDLAGDALSRVKAPTLLLVGSWDEAGLELNRAALTRLTCHKELEVIPGATQLFDEPGALDNVARWSAPWFVRYLMLERTWGEAGGCEGSCSCKL